MAPAPRRRDPHPLEARAAEGPRATLGLDLLSKRRERVEGSHPRELLMLQDALQVGYAIDAYPLPPGPPPPLLARWEVCNGVSTLFRCLGGVSLFGVNGRGMMLC